MSRELDKVAAVTHGTFQAGSWRSHNAAKMLAACVWCCSTRGKKYKDISSAGAIFLTFCALKFRFLGTEFIFASSVGWRCS
jgi:hypothetical protein